jgi:Zn-dependent protease
LSLGGRWRSARAQLQLPNIIIAVAVLGIVVVVLVLGVKRGDIGSTQAIYLAVLIPSIILHEISHGVVALWCGDDTAKRAGRLTLNPLAHVDPVGSILVPILMVLSVGRPFGWAKPVPVNISRLRHPRDQAVLVSLAGPATNIILASVAGIVFHFTVGPHVLIGGQLYTQSGLDLVNQFIIAFGVVNIIVAVFNLIPIPPLDGSALVERLLPASVLPQYYRMRFAFMVVVLILFIADQNALNQIFDHFQSWYLEIFVR